MSSLWDNTNLNNRNNDLRSDTNRNNNAATWGLLPWITANDR